MSIYETEEGAARLRAWRTYDHRYSIPRSAAIERVEVDRAGNIWLSFGSSRVLARCQPAR